MKSIIYQKNGTKGAAEEIIEYLVAYGEREILLISERECVDVEFYKMNGINLKVHILKEGEGLSDALHSEGAFIDESQFMIIFGREIVEIDLDNFKRFHNQGTKLLSILQRESRDEKRMLSVICENETLDYLSPSIDFQRTVISKIGESGEIDIYVYNCM